MYCKYVNDLQCDGTVVRFRLCKYFNKYFIDDNAQKDIGI